MNCRPAPGAAENLDRPVIVEVDKAEDRWWMWASGFAYGLVVGGLAGACVAVWWIG